MVSSNYPLPVGGGIYDCGRAIARDPADHQFWVALVDAAYTYEPEHTWADVVGWIIIHEAMVTKVEHNHLQAEPVWWLCVSGPPYNSMVVYTGQTLVAWKPTPLITPTGAETTITWPSPEGVWSLSQ